MRALTLILLLVAGIFAGEQLGKIAPLVTWYQTEGGLSLVAAGWLAALIGVFVAIAALPAGWVIDRVGARQAAVVSFVVLAAGGLMLATATQPSLVLVARLIEAAGYLALVIAVPALLSDLSPSSWRASVMAIWGGFVPIGFAIANYLGEAVIPAFGPPAFLLASVVLFAATASPASYLVFKVDDIAPRATSSERPALRDSMSPSVLLIAAAFGLYVVSSLGFFTFMPAFVEANEGRLLVSAGLIALLVPLGNVIAGALMHGRSERFIIWLAVVAFSLTVALGVPAFTVTAPAVATACAMGLAIAGGLMASSLFAAIPPLVPAKGSVSVAIALVAQAGGIGTLVGPPLAGAIIENWSWPGLGAYLSAGAALGVLALLPIALRRSESAPLHVALAN